VTAGWVAGTVRARAMARRVLGAEAVRQVAASRSLPEAQRMLQSTCFRDAAEPGLSLAMAQHAVGAAILWELRVLAGWLPRDGVSLLRLLAGWFEIANVDELLQAQAGLPAGPEFQLGALATAWPRLSETRGAAELRRALAASTWGDPGSDTSRDIRLAIRARWAARVAKSGGRARIWATSAAAMLRSGQGAQPWEAEAAWWRRVESDGRVLLHSAATDSGPVLGAVAVMAADARRLRAALASAARGGQALEVYDALA
jgi:hypothetical protein